MAIRKNVSKNVIRYNTKEDFQMMEKIISKQQDNYFRTNEKDSENIEDFSFDEEYIVRRGETLSKIASKYGITYQELADYNNITDPNYIEIGQTINIPTKENDIPPAPNDFHTVSGGETLSQIASKYGITYQELADYNNIADPNYIEVGQKIKIPPTDSLPTNSKDPDQNIAEEIKNISKKLVENIESMGSKLGDKIKEAYNNNLNDAEKAKNIVLEVLKNTGITLNDKIIEKIVDNKENIISLANQLKQEAEALTASLPLITKKIKQAYQENNNKAINIKQIIADALKNINIPNIDNYIDMIHYAYFKNSSNTEYVINENIVNQKEDIAIPTHGEVTYEGDYLYLNSPDCDFKFKIPLAKFEVDENDKKNVKIVELEGEKKEEYIRKAKQYVSDYINGTKNLDYDFIETLKNSGLDKEIQILYLKNGGYAGMTVHGKKLVINGNTIVYDEEDKRNVAQKILIHELGHAYDSAKGRISKSEEWQEIYSQIHKEANSELMSITMKGKANEWFARCVDNYYVYPERLTQIKINYGNYYNLYDYMKDLLSGK